MSERLPDNITPRKAADLNEQNLVELKKDDETLADAQINQKEMLRSLEGNAYVMEALTDPVDPQLAVLELLKEGGNNGIQTIASKLVMEKLLERKINRQQLAGKEFAEKYGSQLWAAAKAEASLDGVEIKEESK